MNNGETLTLTHSHAVESEVTADSLKLNQAEKLVPPDKALSCPNCGKVVAIEGRGSNTCPACSSELMAQEEGYALTLAKRSHVKGCLPFPQMAKKYPALTFLGNQGRFGYDRLNDFSTYGGEKLVSDLKANQKILPEQRLFAENHVFELFFDKYSLYRDILTIPDELWQICDGKDGAGELTKNIVLPLAHPNKRFSLLRVSHSLLRSYRDNSDIFQLKALKTFNPPKTEAEFLELTHGNGGYNRSKKVEDGIIEEEGMQFSYDGGPSLYGVSDKEYQEALALLAAMPLGREQAMAYFRQKLTQTETQSPEINLTLCSQILKAMDYWYATEIPAKIARVVALRGPSRAPIGEPEIDHEAVEKIDNNYFVDLAQENKASAEKGVALACSKCGRGLPFTGASFIKCASCDSYNDLVQTKRISSEKLYTREYSETFVPFEYFVHLLFEQQALDQQKNDPDPVDAEAVLQSIMKAEFVDKAEKEVASFLVVNAVLKIGLRHPHLFSLLNYQKHGDTSHGFIFTLAVPDSPQLTLPRGSATSSLEINDLLRDKLVLFKVDGFDRPRYSGQDFAWCKFGAGVLSKEELGGIHDQSRLIDISRGSEKGLDVKHWLDMFGYFGLTIGTSINYNAETQLERKSGRYYNMIISILRTIPDGVELGKLLAKKKSNQEKEQREKPAVTDKASETSKPVKESLSWAPLTEKTKRELPEGVEEIGDGQYQFNGEKPWEERFSKLLGSFFGGKK